jgi:hypothetical protein
MKSMHDTKMVTIFLPSCFILIVRAVHFLMDQDKDGERVGEQGGGGHELFNFLGGGLGLHFAKFLTCFALVHT